MKNIDDSSKFVNIISVENEPTGVSLKDSTRFILPDSTENRIKIIFNTIKKTNILNEGYENVSYENFKEVLLTSKEAQDDVHKDLLNYQLVSRKDPDEYWDKVGIRKFVINRNKIYNTKQSIKNQNKERNDNYKEFKILSSQELWISIFLFIFINLVIFKFLCKKKVALFVSTISLALILGSYLIYNNDINKADRAIKLWSYENIAEIKLYEPISNSSIFLEKNKNLPPYFIIHKFRKKYKGEWLLIELKLYFNSDFDKVICSFPTNWTLSRFWYLNLEFSPKYYQ